VYHFLNKNERRVFRETVMRLLKPNGLLFLSTLSVRDTEYYGKGIRIYEEPNSFLYEYSPGKRVYLHFCTREELVADFAFLEIKELYEHEQYDPRVKGPVNYIPWILIGEYADTLQDRIGKCR
jgi:2-polyprenyl-3-methyl-5-hydroxy-6-metoxy-1,4-benzoquinol methylase